jgi:hypothetical protein
LAWLGLAGCSPYRFATVDEACPDQLAGEAQLEPGTAAMLSRFACYRRFEGLQMPRITPGAQDAVAAHAHYMEVNGILDPESPYFAQTLNDVFREDPSLPGFTGRDAVARLVHFEALDLTTSFGLWDVILPDGGAGVADLNVADPYTRDVVFQPLWYAVGYAVIDTPGVDAGYFSAVYATPPASHVAHPIVYPRDGQTDLPASYATIGDEADPMSVVPISGFPITISVGAFESNGSDNPFDLHPVSATLTGEEGEIQLIVVPPGSYPWGPMVGTIAYAPYEQLVPGHTYEFDAKIRWNAYPNGKDVHSTFTVADDAQTVDLTQTAKMGPIR